MNRRFATLSLLATLLVACASLAFGATAPRTHPFRDATCRALDCRTAPRIVLAGSRQATGPMERQLHRPDPCRSAPSPWLAPILSKTNVTTNFTVWVIPIKFVYDASHGNKTFDPSKHKLSNGRTVIQNVLKSPLFNAGIDFKQGATDLGNTQYEDAFQRGTWWGKNVKKNNKYHVLLKPVLKPEQTINCTDDSCQVDTFHFGSDPNITAGLEDINNYDSLVQGFMTKLGATPDILPLFVFYDT